MCCDRVLGADAPFTPSPAASRRHVDLDPVPASVGLARAFVRDSLAGLDDDGREVALLLTSELVTNAILHARTTVQVGVLLDADQALVCVADRLGESGPLVPQEQSRTRPGGRGLALVDDLAQRWGTTVYTGGKTVWFVLASARDRSLRAG